MIFYISECFSFFSAITNPNQAKSEFGEVKY